MADALVGIAEPVTDRPVGAEDQEVGLGRPGADAGLAQRAGLGLEQEGPARRQLAAEALGGEVEEQALGTDRALTAIVELVRQDEAVAVAGMRRQGCLALADGDRPVDNQGLARPVLLDDPRGAEGL